MKVEIHSGVHEEPQAGNQSTCVIGETSRVGGPTKELPGIPEKENQKGKSAKAADGARFSKGLHIVIVAVIHDQAIIKRFVKRKDFLQGAQARPDDPVVLVDVQAALHHFRPEAFA